MNRKIIYVDFVFKRRKLSSRTIHFIYKLKVKLKHLFNKIFKNRKRKINSNIYPFKKVL
ncbi:hypothetical protein SDC9_45561 [bioreactor metagenome]|jgi:hypothetical protein|uniref:Uncharacterized protein n=1 Tax=bioreactor metagenome TaxID=1076179 RepID=A0A644W6C4_9ZZZZ